MTAFLGVAAVVGHSWPVYLQFKGGKGVATGAGVLFALNWIACAVGMGVFVVVFLPFRYVSLGSIVAALSVPVTNFFTAGRFWADRQERIVTTVFCVLLALIVVARHRANIRRLLKGEESKFSFTRARDG